MIRTTASCASTTALTPTRDRKSTRLNSSHGYISYAVFCLKKKNHDDHRGGDQPGASPNDGHRLGQPSPTLHLERPPLQNSPPVYPAAHAVEPPERPSPGPD